MTWLLLGAVCGLLWAVWSLGSRKPEPKAGECPECRWHRWCVATGIARADSEPVAHECCEAAAQDHSQRGNARY